MINLILIQPHVYKCRCFPAQIPSRALINKVATTRQSKDTDYTSTMLFSRRKSHYFAPHLLSLSLPAFDLFLSSDSWSCLNSELSAPGQYSCTSAALDTVLILRDRGRVSFVGCCFGSACRRWSSCWCGLAALGEVTSGTGFAKGVYKYSGATAKWAAGVLSLSFAKLRHRPQLLFWLLACCTCVLSLFLLLREKTEQIDLHKFGGRTSQWWQLGP